MNDFAGHKLNVGDYVIMISPEQKAALTYGIIAKIGAVKVTVEFEGEYRKKKSPRFPEQLFKITDTSKK